MAQKAQEAAKAEESYYVDDDGCICLKGQLFWKYRAVESDYARVQMELKHKTDELYTLMSKDETLRKIFGERQALINESSAKMGEVKEVQQQIEKLLNVRLTNCSFDDKTGRIFDLSNGKQTPIKPAKKRARKGTARPAK